MADTNVIYWGINAGKKKELSDAITTAVAKGEKPLSEYTSSEWDSLVDRLMSNTNQHNGTSENNLDDRTKNLVELLYKNGEISTLDRAGNVIAKRNRPAGWYVLHGKVDGDIALTETVFSFLKSEFHREYGRRIRSTDTIVYYDHSFTIFFPVTANYKSFVEGITRQLALALNGFGYRVYGSPVTEEDLEGAYFEGQDDRVIRKMVVATNKRHEFYEARVAAEKVA
jgi:hypothetical protein